MPWSSKREKISPTEARRLGLMHVRDQDTVHASASRKSLTVESGAGHPTGFTKAGGSWKVHEYHDQMAGKLQRAPASDAYDYGTFLKGHGIPTDTFNDRRGPVEYHRCSSCLGEGQLQVGSGSHTRTCEDCGGEGKVETSR